MIEQAADSPLPDNSGPGRLRQLAAAGFFLTLAVLVIGGVYAYSSIRQVAGYHAEVRSTNNLLVMLESLLSTVKDAETGQRGYLLTGDAKYLDPYHVALGSVSAELTQLAASTTADDLQRARLDSLKTAITLKLDEVAATLALADRGDHAAAVALVRSDTGMRLMNSARATVASMQSQERDRRNRLTDAADRAGNVLAICIALTIGLAGILVSLVLYLTRRYAREQAAAHSVLVAQRELITATLADLAESGQRKDEFLATLAHELRNPLAPIRNGLQLLRFAGTDATRATATVNTLTMIERQVGQLVRLVDDLLDVSRISRGKQQLRREIVNLVTILEHAMETSRPVIELRGHRVRATLPDDAVMIDADPTRIEQVFTNLLNNAAKYSRDAGTIELTLTTSEREAEVHVHDAGIGISAEMLPHIFELFTQADDGLSRSEGGLGIGLTLVKGLVEMHGGRVEARSNGPDSGSDFVVWLPLAATGSRTPAIGSRDDAEHRMPARALRVLVADDNEDSATTLGLLLEAIGHGTRVVNDGAAAVAAAEEFQPDVIFLDIGMPTLNGYEACQRIRTATSGREPLIVALTGWGQASDKQRSAEAGFDRHLVKPLDAAALDDVLAAAAARH